VATPGSKPLIAERWYSLGFLRKMEGFWQEGWKMERHLARMERLVQGIKISFERSHRVVFNVRVFEGAPLTTPVSLARLRFFKSGSSKYGEPGDR
jgi:hypothetical protein